MNDLHAYTSEKCYCSLEEHLINTLKTVLYSHLSKRVKAVSKRIQPLAGVRDEPDWQDLYNILLLPVLLHDIGKAIEKYQKMRKGYWLHEVFGALILYDLLEIDRVKQVLDERSLNVNLVKPIVIYPVLLHHYSFRDIKDIHEGSKDYEVDPSTRLAGETLSRLIDVLIDKLKSLHSEMGGMNLLIYILQAFRSDLHEYSFTVKRKLSKHLETVETNLKTNISNLGKKLDGARYIVSTHISSVTGVVNASDYLAASIERRSCHQKSRESFSPFVVRVFSGDEISIIESMLTDCICVE